MSSTPSRLDRAWVRRGLVRPAPWGATLTGAWLDAEVTFSRQTIEDDGYGGFIGGSPRQYLTTRAHVRFQSDGATTGPYTVPTSPSGTDTNRRRLDIRLPRPSDSADIPRKGDRVEYTIDRGDTLNLFIANVHSPRNFSDHIKVETEWFE
jgi:hypothetical protein